jgi:hypothetical protein
MHRAPSVDVSPHPSRLIAGWIMLVAVVTAGVVAVLPFDAWLRGLSACAIAAWAARAVRRDAWRRHSGAVRLLRLDGNLDVRAVTASGRALRGRVLPATYVGSRLTTLVWRADGARVARTECLVSDSLPAEDFRRLRVQLRYGRSEDSDGAPASHA